MDDQNFQEKIGIIRDLSEIKTILVKQDAELAYIKLQKTEMHTELKKLLDDFNAVINGAGDKIGLVTLVDRLVQTEINRRANFMVIYSALVAMAVKMIYDFVKH